MVKKEEFSSPYRRFYTKDRTWEQLIHKARQGEKAPQPPTSKSKDEKIK